MTQQKIIRLVATNDRGIRVGEYHQNAKLSDIEVEQVRDLHEFANWTYEQIADAYGVSKWSISRICRFERRNQVYEFWKKVKVIPGPREVTVMVED